MKYNIPRKGRKFFTIRSQKLNSDGLCVLIKGFCILCVGKSNENPLFRTLK
jgi:hypothetical protein